MDGKRTCGGSEFQTTGVALLAKLGFSDLEIIQHTHYIVKSYLA